jgi:hypothetical protein
MNDDLFHVCVAFAYYQAKYNLVLRFKVVQPIPYMAMMYFLENQWFGQHSSSCLVPISHELNG